MADKKAVVDEKMALSAEVSTSVNEPAKISLRERLGTLVVALGCVPCGRYLGLEHDPKSKKSCSGGSDPKDDTDPPHEPTPAARFDADTVVIDKATDRMIRGRQIPPPEDPDDLQKQIEELQERHKAAVAAKKKG